jgi:FkbM family methyltransferase
VRPPEGGLVVEGGVFDGETTLSFAKLVGRRGVVYAFDPLGDRYAKRHLSMADETHGRVEVVPAALWHATTTLSFSDAGAGTIVSDSSAGGDRVEAVSIDEFFARRNVPRFDFFKLDVEGAELHAIKGAANAIRTHRPICALSIYHGMHQYFEVPLYFRDQFEGYRYDIDYYSPDGLETVLYCTPLR